MSVTAPLLDKYGVPFSSHFSRTRQNANSSTSVVAMGAPYQANPGKMVEISRRAPVPLPWVLCVFSVRGPQS